MNTINYTFPDFNFSPLSSFETFNFGPIISAVIASAIVWVGYFLCRSGKMNYLNRNSYVFYTAAVAVFIFGSIYSYVAGY